MEIIRSFPNNESSWNYLYGLVLPLSNEHVKLHTKEVSGDSDAISINIDFIRKFAEDLIASNPVANNSRIVLGFLVDIYTDTIRKKCSTTATNKNNPIQ